MGGGGQIRTTAGNLSVKSDNVWVVGTERSALLRPLTFFLHQRRRRRHHKRLFTQRQKCLRITALYGSFQGGYPRLGSRVTRLRLPQTDRHVGDLMFDKR
ncbi:hypothetical protein AA0242T_1426 [Acetobacter aceti NRIC 0242]|nr:hypothetical protein AA0242T_1426 [Acetobacter aceti NRIC 0242]